MSLVISYLSIQDIFVLIFFGGFPCDNADLVTFALMDDTCNTSFQKKKYCSFFNVKCVKWLHHLPKLGFNLDMRLLLTLTNGGCILRVDLTSPN